MKHPQPDSYRIDWALPELGDKVPRAATAAHPADSRVSRHAARASLRTQPRTDRDAPANAARRHA